MGARLQGLVGFVERVLSMACMRLFCRCPTDSILGSESQLLHIQTGGLQLFVIGREALPKKVGVAYLLQVWYDDKTLQVVYRFREGRALRSLGDSQSLGVQIPRQLTRFLKGIFKIMAWSKYSLLEASDLGTSEKQN